ncbi:hypothetical protein PF005_g8400 [Phytophthora fragariae]|uniref:Uncharacterized protein n=1 Tax=Phytophthora fragariae TaxID=53985 RepID=A0A6A3YGP3_9STRA|nr:hypothetical protein PF005_g8400 [Phytophthora fragariae]
MHGSGSAGQRVSFGLLVARCFPDIQTGNERTGGHGAAWPVTATWARDWRVTYDTLSAIVPIAFVYRKLNAVTRTTASLLRRRRGQAQSASGSCAVTTAHLFQAPNVIRSPVAVLARFYLAPAHLYQPRKWA